MERLMYAWNELNDWVYANWEDPLFQLLQGIVVGILIMIAVWAGKKAGKKAAKKAREK